MEALISDSELIKIPIRDCGERLVDLEKYIPEIIIKLSPRIYGHRKFKAYLREEAAKRLKRAQKFLPKGFVLKVVDAYRPVAIQEKLFKRKLGLVKKQHPKWSVEKIYDYASKYTADPKVIAPHSTGGSVDVTIGDREGEGLDMGGTSIANSYTKSDNISSTAKNNRALLIKVMTKVGFVNYPTEWWHWSYGDKYWAVVKKKKWAIYSSIEKFEDI